MLFCTQLAVHGANMGPTWVLSAPDGTHVAPMNIAIRGYIIFVIGSGIRHDWPSAREAQIISIGTQLQQATLVLTMMTSSNGNIFRVTCPLCGEFPGHRWIPPTKASGRSFDFLFDLQLNKRFSTQSWGW